MVVLGKALCQSKQGKGKTLLVSDLLHGADHGQILPHKVGATRARSARTLLLKTQWQVIRRQSLRLKLSL